MRPVRDGRKRRQNTHARREGVLLRYREPGTRGLEGLEGLEGLDVLDTIEGLDTLDVLEALGV